MKAADLAPIIKELQAAGKTSLRVPLPLHRQTSFGLTADSAIPTVRK
jgi:hypothetical protein